MESTVVLLKPDSIERNLIGSILNYFENVGLKISRMRSVLYPSKSICEQHYQEHRGRYFFEQNVEFLHGGLVVALIIEEEDAVRRVRDLVGATDPADAVSGTIRGDFGGKLPCNLVHASDSLDAAERESLLWFA